MKGATMIRTVLCNNKGFGLPLIISMFSLLMFFTVLPVFFLIPYVMEQMQSFVDEASTDCFLAARSAVIQMESAQKANDIEGEFDQERCKAFFREHLAFTFNLNNDGSNFLAATGSGYVRSIEITEYSLDVSDPGQPVLTSQVSITTNIPYLSHLPRPVHKIRNVIKIKYLED
jgi:hypothetical protein